MLLSRGRVLSWQQSVGIKSGLITGPVVFLHLLLILAAMPQCEAQSTAGTRLSKEDILASVEAARSRMEDMSASFSFNMTHGRADQDKGTRCDIVLKGEKIYMKKAMCQDPAVSSKWFSNEVAYNGERTTSYLPSMASASIQKIKDISTSSQQTIITEFMMLRPPGGAPPGVVTPNSLVSALGSSMANLRETLDEVNGRRCYVLDVMDPYSDQIVSTIWLDPDWGFLPVRNCAYSKQAPGVPYVEYTIEEAVEAAPGIWIPTRGTHKGRMPGPVPKQDSWLQIDVLEMDRKPDGTFAVAVNSGVQDEFFDFWKRLPPGTKLMDMDAGTSTKVGAPALKEMEDDLKEVLESPELATAARDAETTDSDLSDTQSQVAPEAPKEVQRGRTATAVAMLVLVFIAASAVVIMVRRRHRLNR